MMRCHDEPMRTTLNLDDDVAEAARALARSEGRSLGQVISDLVRRGLRPRPLPEIDVGVFPVFEVASDAAPITGEMVRSALEE